MFKRLPFGLKNGPSSWMKFLDKVLSGIEGIYTYLDDILVFSENVDRHLSILKEVFDRLQSYGLSLALDKCAFGQSTLDFLGFQVSSTGIRPLQTKVEALQQIPPPANRLIEYFLNWDAIIRIVRYIVIPLKKSKNASPGGHFLIILQND